MKISKAKLRQIIKEEISSIMGEASYSGIHKTSPDLSPETREVIEKAYELVAKADMPGARSALMDRIAALDNWEPESLEDPEIMALWNAFEKLGFKPRDIYGEPGYWESNKSQNNPWHHPHILYTSNID